MEPIRTLIVDDEPIARDGLRLLLSRFENIAVVGEAGTGFDALQRIRITAPELVFLDIQMPDLDGLGVLDQLDRASKPAIVFVTAFGEYAVSAFDLDAVDYVMKPFDFPRLSRAVERATTFLRPAEDSVRFTVRTSYGIEIVAAPDVDWIESRGNYVRLHVGGRRLLLRQTLTGVAARLDPIRFLRVSRSAIVNTAKVQSLRPRLNGQLELHLTTAESVLASRRYRGRLKRTFQIP
jgi:two-component system LytT family response regulator